MASVSLLPEATLREAATWFVNMGYSSEEDSDISDSEIGNSVKKVYQKLQVGGYKVKLSNVSLRCPFCQGKKKQEYLYKDLLQHANGVGASSNRKIREKANHQALAMFLMTDLSEVQGPLKPIVEKLPQAHKDEERFVWPWMGILVNIPTTLIDGKYVGETKSKLQEKYAKFNPVKVHALWNSRGHTGCAVVEFRKDWSGFKDAMAFENLFETNLQGKQHWSEQKLRKASVYGWVARTDDYNSDGAIGEHLKKNGDLKTVTDVEEEESRKTEKLVANLASEIDEKNKNLNELECRYNETTLSLNMMMKQKNMLYQAYNEEIRRLQFEAGHHLDKVRRDNEKQRMELANRKREFEMRSQQLDKRETQNENDRKQLEAEKLKNAAENCSLQRATVEQQKVDENVLRLMEEQKLAKKHVFDQMIQLEKQLEAKQKLELDIEQLKGNLLVLQHMGNIDDSTDNKIEALKNKLTEKESEMESLEELNTTLLMKERKSTDEIQKARKELIVGLKDMLSGSRPNIGIKRMGELDPKAFKNVCQRKFPTAEADVNAMELCSLWDERLRNPEWHPFKIVKDEGKTDEVRRIIDEDDAQLQELKNKWGDEVFNAVTTALVELNEYNASGGYIVEELWHFKENRKATLKEVIQYIFMQWKSHSHKRKR